MKNYEDKIYRKSFWTIQAGVSCCWCADYLDASTSDAECYKDCDVCLGYGIMPISLEDLK